MVEILEKENTYLESARFQFSVYIQINIKISI